MALLGIDIGTASVKAAAFDEEGRLLAEASRPLTLHTPRPGWAEQHPDDWWEAACVCCRSVAARVNDIRAVGIAGQSWAMVLVDDAGEVLFPTPIWMDQRAADICESLDERLRRRAFLTGGNPFAPGYTTPKLLWMRRYRPEILEKTRWVLQSNGFIAYRLTGEISQDKSQGYGLHCYAMKSGIWDASLGNALGVESRWLPPIMGCADVVGRITANAALDTGLREGIPVVAGGLDAACAAFGAGVVEPGQTQEQGGQAGGMGICLDKNSYASDERLILSAHVLPDLWLLQGGTVGGGGALKWLHANMGAAADAEAERRGVSPFTVLCEWAGEIAPGSEGLTFLPYLSGERSPLWDAKAKGLYYGLDYGKTIKHIARATLEGVAYSLRHNIETAQLAGANVGSLHAMGGAALSPVWTQIKADVCQKTVKVPDAAGATNLGAAMLAGLSQGDWRDGVQAAQATVRFTRKHTPNPANAAAYDAGYEIYRKLYPALKGIDGCEGVD